MDQSIGSRFCLVASAVPDRVAVRGEDGDLTYGELDRLTNGLAHRLVERLGNSQQAVALDVRQGAAFVVAVLAVLKAGKYFVPLDARRPGTIEPILDACDCALMLRDARHASTTARPILVVDPYDPQSARVESPPDVIVNGDSHCCVYFTTGTTGSPKGVFDCHRNVLHNTWRYTVSLSPRSDDRFSMIQSPSFSGCLSSLFTSLLNGATLCPFDLAGNGLARLPHWARRADVTIFHAVPALFQALARPGSSCPSMRIVRLEGDRVTRASVDAWRLHCPAESRLIIGLGATECGLACRFEVDRERAEDFDGAPLGYPCADIDVRIEDDKGVTLPDGGIGEIIIDSDFLALGYLGREDLTAAAFNVDPVSGRRRYRTGDLGYLDPDGCLHYVARRGDALRLNGKPIDPAPLEQAARATGLTAECIVGQHLDEHGIARLVLYYVPAAQAVLSPLMLNRALARHAPRDRLPGWIVALDSLPLSADGKVARDALPPPASTHRVRPEAGTAPRTDLEQSIARSWESVLGYPLTDVNQNVFELGVDSLACEQFLAALERTTNVRPGIELVFDYPEVAALAAHIESGGGHPEHDSNAAVDVGRARRAAVSARLRAMRTGRTQREQ